MKLSIVGGTDASLGKMEFGVLQFLMQMCCSSDVHEGRWVSIGFLTKLLMESPHFRVRRTVSNTTSSLFTNGSTTGSSSHRNGLRGKRKRTSSAHASGIAEDGLNQRAGREDGDCIWTFKEAHAILTKVLLMSSNPLAFECNALSEKKKESLPSTGSLPTLLVKRMNCVEVITELSNVTTRKNYLLLRMEYFKLLEEYKYLCNVVCKTEIEINPDFYSGVSSTKIDAVPRDEWMHRFVRFGGFWQFSQQSLMYRIIYETKLNDCIGSRSTTVKIPSSSSPTRKRMRQPQNTKSISSFPNINLGFGGGIGNALKNMPQRRMLKKLSIQMVEKKYGPEFVALLHTFNRLVVMHFMLKPCKFYSISSIEEKLRGFIENNDAAATRFTEITKFVFANFTEFCGTFVCPTCIPKLEDGIYFDEEGTCMAFFQAEMYGRLPELRMGMRTTNSFGEGSSFYGTLESLLGPASIIFPQAPGSNSYALAAFHDQPVSMTESKLCSQLFMFTQHHAGVPSFKDTMAFHRPKTHQ